MVLQLQQKITRAHFITALTPQRPDLARNNSIQQGKNREEMEKAESSQPWGKHLSPGGKGEKVLKCWPSVRRLPWTSLEKVIPLALRIHENFPWAYVCVFLNFHSLAFLANNVGNAWLAGEKFSIFHSPFCIFHFDLQMNLIRWYSGVYYVWVGCVIKWVRIIDTPQT